MALAYLTFAVLLGLLTWRAGWRAPATLFAMYFLAVMAFFDLSDIALAPLMTEARWTIMIGLIGFSLPTILLGHQKSHSANRIVASCKVRHFDGADDKVAKPPTRMLVWSAILLALTAVGFLQTPHLGVGLTLNDIRRATTLQALSQQDVGVGPLMIALAPLVSCLGVIGAVRYRRRRWLALCVAALAATLPTPDKTATLTVVVTAVTTYFLCRPAVRTVQPRRIRTVLVLGIAGMASVTYFVAVNTALNKGTNLNLQLLPTWVPSALVGPALYELGGMSALSVAQSAHIDPRADAYGRSVYAVPWALRFIDHSFHKPQTIAQEVPIPVPFNVYTGFGDMWFDFGWIGVFLISAAFGGSVALAHWRWRRDSYHWTIILALMCGLMASMPLSFRLFYLDTVFQLTVAYVVFRHIAAAEQASTSRAAMALSPAPFRPKW